jgi:hypothetical protein
MYFYGRSFQAIPVARTTADPTLTEPLNPANHKTKIKRTLSLLTLCAINTLLSAQANAATYTVPASANISSAGLAAPVAPGGEGAGTLPVLHSILAGQTAFRFSTAGSVSQYFDYFSQSGDGSGYSADISNYGGISGYKGDTIFPFVGVFLGSGVPQAPAPATLQFTSAVLGFNFTTLSPSLGQIFFIGDGKANGITDQTFFAPEGATRLYLGFPDAPNSTGAPGGFADNRGSLEVQLTAVPEPAAATLLLVAGGFLRIRSQNVFRKYKTASSHF